MQTALDFQVRDIRGKAVDLKQYLGKVVLMVNTASHCGFTPQYQGLETLYQQFQSSGVVVLGFPCNQFGKQEPGEADDIRHFCEQHFQITFPLFSKIEVNGENAHPLFRYLKAAAPGILGSQSIKWNFTKFLIDDRGQVIRRYAPQTSPEHIAKDIQALLPVSTARQK
jgi:glutathione peroxidase